MFGRRLLLACCLLLPSCTIVRVEGAKSVAITRFGALRIEPDPSAAVVSYQSEGFGLVPTIGGVTIGYSRESTAMQYAGSACSIIIFELPDEGDAREMWEQLLSQRNDLCLLGESKK
jgi:hypothetical protein